MPISSKPVHCCIPWYMCRVFFFWLGCCPSLYVRTSYVSRDPVSYIVSAYLVSCCLFVRQQQRFHHPTLKPTPTCPSAESGVHCCIPVSYTHLRAHETKANLVCRLLLEKKKSDVGEQLLWSRRGQPRFRLCSCTRYVFSIRPLTCGAKKTKTVCRR